MSLIKFLQTKKQQQVKNLILDDLVVDVNEEILLHEYREGVQVAESCRVSGLTSVFSWKRGFQNCFTAYPNDGKTMLALYLMTQKSLHDGWKWVFWSPEMKSASFINDRIFVHYNDLINEIVWIVSGQTPYKHFADKYFIPQVNEAEYIRIIKWAKEHFIPLDPKDKTADGIYTSLLKYFEKSGFDGILVDPFKNIQYDGKVRDDIHMEQIFAKFKDLAIQTNSVMNWIAHPKAGGERMKDGVLQPVTPWMLNGGAAWDNSMDGIYSVFRPDIKTDPRSPRVNFINMKQRKQELTTERGISDGMFDIKTRRYTFIGL
jgi:hypothetical protein